MNSTINNRIVLFDGVCNLCNYTVNFIIKHDPNAIFKFAPLQSEKGKKLIKKNNFFQELETIILLEDEKIYVKSSAVLRIVKSLSGMWSLLYMLHFVPRFIRDILYNLIVRNRYKWFGKKESCMIPTEEVRNRFL